MPSPATDSHRRGTSAPPRRSGRCGHLSNQREPKTRPSTGGVEALFAAGIVRRAFGVPREGLPVRWLSDRVAGACLLKPVALTPEVLDELEGQTADAETVNVGAVVLLD